MQRAERRRLMKKHVRNVELKYKLKRRYMRDRVREILGGATLRQQWMYCKIFTDQTVA